MMNYEKWYTCWKSARQRCTNKNADNYKYYGGKGIKCLLTKEDVYYLWVRDNGNNIHNPQLSRINHNADYTIDNCKFVSKTNNIGERNHRVLKKVVLQFDLQGNFIKEWDCISEVEHKLKIFHNSISRCASGKSKTAGGFIWKYK